MVVTTASNFSSFPPPLANQCPFVNGQCPFTWFNFSKGRNVIISHDETDWITIHLWLLDEQVVKCNRL